MIAYKSLGGLAVAHIHSKYFVAFSLNLYHETQMKNLCAKVILLVSQSGNADLFRTSFLTDLNLQSV